METLLACVDFTDVTILVLKEAETLAKLSGARLFLLHVAPEEPDWVGYDPGPQSVRDAVASDLRNAHRNNQSLAQGLRDKGIDATALTVQGPGPETILDHAKRLDADLIVIGSHRKNLLSQWVLGSVARSVLRKSVSPVLVVPEER